MKRALALILVLVEIVSMVLLACSIASRFSREEESYAINDSIERRIVTDKAVYVEGEPIMVTAWSPHPMDMVIITPVDENTTRVRWYYVGPVIGSQELAMQGPGSGGTYDIREAFLSKSTVAMAFQDIPAGEYIIYMTTSTGDMANLYCCTTITVVAAQE